MRLRIAAELRDRVAHRGEIDHARHAGEVLQQHARRPVRDLFRRGEPRLPRRERDDVVRGHRTAVLEPQEVLEQDLERVRQRREIVRAAERGEPEVGVLPAAGAQRVARGETVRMRLRHGVRRAFGAACSPCSRRTVPRLLTHVPFFGTIRGRAARRPAACRLRHRDPRPGPDPAGALRERAARARAGPPDRVERERRAPRRHRARTRRRRGVAAGRARRASCCSTAAGTARSSCARCSNGSPAAYPEVGERARTFRERPRRIGKPR